MVIMINENMEKNEDIIKLNKEIDEIGKIRDIWYLKYYLSRIHERYDILKKRKLDSQNDIGITIFLRHRTDFINMTSQISLKLCFFIALI